MKYPHKRQVQDIPGHINPSEIRASSQGVLIGHFNATPMSADAAEEFGLKLLRSAQVSRTMAANTTRRTSPFRQRPSLSVVRERAQDRASRRERVEDVA